MRPRAVWIGFLAAVFVVGLGLRTGRADEEHGSDHDGSAEHHDGSAEHHDGSAEHHAGSAEEHHDGSDEHHAGSAEEHHAGGEHHEPVAEPGATTDGDGDGISDADEQRDADGDGKADIEEESEDPDADEDDPNIKTFDADGDGVVEADEVADNKEFEKEIADLHIPAEPDDEAVEQRRDEAHHATALTPSISLADFQKYVTIAKKVVLGKLEVKIERKTAKRMQTFSLIVVGVSGLGLVLLLMPLVLRKKYPGQGAILFKYSMLAALTFVVTVNLFGGVLYGMRSVQSAMSSYTNPQIAIASGTFDTLHDDAEEYLITGKELFGPAIKQMREHPEQQPIEILLDNGTRLMGDVKVLLSIKGMIKKLDFIFGLIPIILTILTLVLFVLAIRPTLTEIVRMPAVAAQGNAGVGKDVMRKSFGRVIGELKATVCTIGVLVALTLLSSFVLGNTVKPALKAFLEYFAKSVNYLLFAKDASSGLVFVALFGVVLFLVLNLASLILSMAFFLGKCQKIFQQRFNEGTPISTHAHFFKWGVPSVLLVQVFPLVFALATSRLLAALNDTSALQNPDEVSWARIMLLGPLVLVLTFVVTFWAARGLAAIKFLFKYKVKVKTPPGV